MTVEEYRAGFEKIEIIEQNYKASILSITKEKEPNRRHDGLYHEYLRMRTMDMKDDSTTLTVDTK